MTTMKFTKNNGNILKGLALSAFVTATLTALPATADPVQNLSNNAYTEFNQVAFNLPKTGTFELDFHKPKVIAAIEKKSNKTEFNQLAIDHSKMNTAEQFSFMPNFIAAPEKRSNKLEFTSLDRFFISLTEQDGNEHLSAWHQFSVGTDYAGRDQPQLSRSNLLNSPFTKLVAKKLTGPFSP